MVATKSILKSVVIKDKKAAQRLVNALEGAKNKRSKSNQSAVSYSYASAEDLKKMFGSKGE